MTAWGLPTLLVLFGLLTGTNVRTALWTVTLTWMGGACLLNARRCGRTHCRFTGPFYLAMVLPVLIFGSGLVPAGFYTWLLLGGVILAGGKVIW